MKTIFLIIIALSTTLNFASENCKNYAQLTESILKNISIEKQRDLKIIEIDFQRSMSQCSSSDCFSEVKEIYFNKKSIVLQSENKAIIEAYKVLSNNCLN